MSEICPECHTRHERPQEVLARENARLRACLEMIRADCRGEVPLPDDVRDLYDPKTTYAGWIDEALGKP